MKRSALSIIVLLLLAPAAASAADPLEDFPDRGAAQSLSQEARLLIQQSKYSEACPKLEESLRLEPGIGTRMDLADCNEHVGKIATAWAGFLETAARSSKLANAADREKSARKRAQALEPRLPKLVIDVPHTTQGIEVTCDGVAIHGAAWGTAIPVDPGAHRVVVNVPGKTSWVTTVQTKEGETVRAEVPRDLPATQEAARRDPATSLDFATEAPPLHDPATSLDFATEAPPLRDPATSLDFATDVPDATPAATGAFAVGSLLFTFK